MKISTYLCKKIYLFYGNGTTIFISIHKYIHNAHGTCIIQTDSQKMRLKGHMQDLTLKIVSFLIRYHHSLKRFCLMSILLRIVAGDFYNVEISMQVKEKFCINTCSRNNWTLEFGGQGRNVTKCVAVELKHISNENFFISKMVWMYYK